MARQFIASAFIADAAIKTAHIEDASIVEAKIANLAVQAAHIANAAIESAKIKDLAVTNLKIGDLEVDERVLANLAVSTGKLQNLAVTTAKIANLAVTNAKIVSLSADKITAGIISASIEILSPLIRGGTYQGLASNSAYLKVGGSSNLGDFSLYRGGTTAPLFQIYDEIPGISMSTLNNLNQLRTFLLTLGDETFPQGNWDFSGANTTGIVARFA